MALGKVSLWAQISIDIWEVHSHSSLPPWHPTHRYYSTIMAHCFITLYLSIFPSRLQTLWSQIPPPHFILFVSAVLITSISLIDRKCFIYLLCICGFKTNQVQQTFLDFSRWRLESLLTLLGIQWNKDPGKILLSSDLFKHRWILILTDHFNELLGHNSSVLILHHTVCCTTS